MKLIEGEAGRTYLVTEVRIEERLTRRLEALGVNEETPVTILNKKGSGSLIIKVRGTRLALGKKIAEGIAVEALRTETAAGAKAREIRNLQKNRTDRESDTGRTADVPPAERAKMPSGADRKTGTAGGGKAARS